MKLRMTLATVALALGTLAGCGTEEDAPPSSTPSPSASTEETPSAEPTASGAPQAAADLVGEWNDADADWTVRFEADGTFTEDFQGVEDFRTGQYTLDGATVTLEGGDGNATTGTVEGETLVFKLGTLTRK